MTISKQHLKTRKKNLKHLFKDIFNSKTLFSFVWVCDNLVITLLWFLITNHQNIPHNFREGRAKFLKKEKKKSLHLPPFENWIIEIISNTIFLYLINKKNRSELRTKISLGPLFYSTTFIRSILQNPLEKYIEEESRACFPSLYKEVFGS